MFEIEVDDLCFSRCNHRANDQWDVAACQVVGFERLARHAVVFVDTRFHGHDLAAQDHGGIHLAKRHAEQIEQANAGASALQVFDSWAGILSRADYVRFIQPFNRRLFELIGSTEVPLINFSTGTSTHLDQVALCGGDVIGVDWRLPIDQAWGAIGSDRAIQGNLDPTALLGPWDELRQQVDSILDGVDRRPGHIFNLGHGILPPTPIDTVKRLTDYVHERTA